MLGRRELPQDRSQLVAQFGKALIEKLLNRISAFCQNLARSRIAGGLDGELETFRYGLAPFAPAGRLLPAIEGGIYLDRSKMLRGVFQLSPLDQTVGIEDAAPGLVRPAPYADADRQPSIHSVKNEVWAAFSSAIVLPNSVSPPVFPIRLNPIEAVSSFSVPLASASFSACVSGTVTM